jgi:ArsR family transcriptional regulator, arsenate/arsenite/antimonite-responsive transcriptional repressor
VPRSADVPSAPDATVILETTAAPETTGVPGDTSEPDPIEVLRALAHPVRWGILERLAAEPGICACDFTEFFEVSQPTISAHLKVLREAGLVTTRRRGTTICYTLVSGRLAGLAGRLGGMAATAPATPPKPQP